MRADELKLALVGYGKMGRTIASLVEDTPHRVVAIIDPCAPEATAASLDPETLAGADVAIEFSTPATGGANVRALIEQGQAVVSGTTGWHEELPELRLLAETRQVPFLWAPNFSLGIAVVARLARQAAPLLAAAGFDPYVFESHHRAKLDGPSGTAAQLAGIIVDGTPEKARFGPAPAQGAIPDDLLPVAWVRAGALPGEHRLGWDALAETVEITHRARDRRVFASGALRAAAWLHGRPGPHTLEEMLDELLHQPGSSQKEPGS
jgi:4-hydroxy-tetrahydrodipicolinate reductase